MVSKNYEVGVLKDMLGVSYINWMLFFHVCILIQGSMRYGIYKHGGSFLGLRCVGFVSFRGVCFDSDSTTDCSSTV